MKNAYEVRGDVTAIIINSPKFGRTETLISTKKLERAKEFPNYWVVSKMKRTMYVTGNYNVVNGKRKRKTIGLHRWVTNAPDNMQVDHINRNGLNNTDENLRIVTKAENLQNKSCYHNTTTGVRGINWCKRENRFLARIQINGKRIQIGRFHSIEEAENAVKEARSKYMPFSNEALA